MKHFADADYNIDKAIAAHNGIPYIAKNCDCWEGYKRVPGTKPCAPGSCEKCDSHSKKSAIKFADEANDRIEAIWNQAVKIAKAQNPNIDESLKEEVIFSCLGKFSFNDITPEIMAEKILQKSNQAVIAKVADTQEQISQFILELNQKYSQLCKSMGVVKPTNAGILPDGRIAQPTPNLQRGGVRTAPAILIDSSFDPGQRPNLIANGIDPANLGLQPLTDQELETFQMSEANRQYAQSLPNSLNQLGYNTKVGSQGDKPSPNAAMDVFETLCSGDEEGAKDMLGMTDCPEGCEVHAEGKCNHGYMSAGRTRVRYLVGSEPFSKEAFGIGDAMKGFKQLNWANLAKEIGMRGVKAIMANRCPVCEGSGKTAVIQCPACDGTGTFEIVKTKVGDLTEENLPRIKQFIQDAMVKVQQTSGGVGAPAPATGEFEDLDDLLA
jgi:hypothetical protein